MKTYNNLYNKIISFHNLLLAWKGARKGKTKKLDVIKFEADLLKNLLELNKELTNQSYSPKPLQTFILRDPKTRKISKSDFRDRIIHHAIIRIIEPIFNKRFICDSCANRKGKGTIYALKRFNKFQRKITNNLTTKAYCLKADIKHYFQEVNHKILLQIIKKKIKCNKTIWLIEQILKNNVFSNPKGEGMPLGNLTSQFFANIYLNELDYFVKHKLKIKFYIRYVDDFMILYKSKEQLKSWKQEINNFLKVKLKLKLHPDKSKIICLSRGVDFVGFRIFYYYKLLRKRNMRNIQTKIKEFSNKKITYWRLMEIYQGWQAYSKLANSYKLRKELVKNIYKSKSKRNLTPYITKSYCRGYILFENRRLKKK